MAKKNEAREYVTLECSVCHKETYTTSKNKKNTPDKMHLNKYCASCKKHTDFKEKK